MRDSSAVDSAAQHRTTGIVADIKVTQRPPQLRTLARSGTPCRHLQVQNQNSVSSVDYSNISIGAEPATPSYQKSWGLFENINFMCFHKIQDVTTAQLSQLQL